MLRRRKARPYRLDQAALEISSKVSVLRTSDDRGWSNVNVSLTAIKPYEDLLVHRAVPDLWVSMCQGPTEATIVADGRKSDLICPSGRMCIIAPDLSVETNRRSEGKILHAFVKRAIITEVAGELFEYDAKFLEIASSFGFEDPGLALLLQSLYQSLLEPVGHADLKVEYLVRALAAHVLRKNANLTDTEPSAHVPLTHRQVQLLANYIRDNLSSKILLNDLAALLNLGQTSLMKRFRTSFRQTPHQYIMETRVNRARELLEQSNLPIVEIAALCGFADQTHLGVVFRRVVGVTPSQYRRSRQ